MIRKLCSATAAVVISGAFAAGCGSSSSSSSSSSSQAPAATTATSTSSTPSGSSTSTAAGSGSAGRASPAVLAACKANLSAQSNLPPQVKAVYARICDQLSHGNRAGALATAAQACQQAIKASGQPPAAQAAALARCPKP